MPRLTLSLLGAFHVEMDGKNIVGFGSNKVRALLAYLAAEVGHSHRRDSLAALLWPEFPDQTALTYLRQGLTNLRHLLHVHDADTPILLISREFHPAQPACRCLGRCVGI